MYSSVQATNLPLSSRITPQYSPSGHFWVTLFPSLLLRWVAGTTEMEWSVPVYQNVLLAGHHRQNVRRRCRTWRISNIDFLYYCATNVRFTVLYGVSCKHPVTRAATVPWHHPIRLQNLQILFSDWLAWLQLEVASQVCRFELAQANSITGQPSTCHFYSGSHPVAAAFRNGTVTVERR